LEFRQTLQEQGKSVSTVWFLHDAVTSTIVGLREGESIEVGLMGPEGVVGLPLIYGMKTSRAAVIVQIPGRATRMRAGHFREHVFESRGPLYELMMAYAHAFADMVAVAAGCNGLHPATRRFCRWVLQVHDRVGADRFPLRQEFLALMLGIRRASVSEIASRYKADGLIDYSRGSMTVVDCEGLEARSCECYELMKKAVESYLP
jgi:CRP-like cAMP-binding protein